MEVPEDLVLVGHVIDAWRLDGGLKIAPYAPEASAMLQAREWWLESKGDVRSFDVMSAKAHGSAVTARLVGIADRDAAEKWKGARISIARRHFPVTDDDEFYWVDLIGLSVVNAAGESFGQVADLLDNGAQQVLVVREAIAVDPDAAAKPDEHLIPFVDAFVKDVDLKARRIVVEWQKDY